MDVRGTVQTDSQALPWQFILAGTCGLPSAPAAQYQWAGCPNRPRQPARVFQKYFLNQSRAQAGALHLAFSCHSLHTHFQCDSQNERTFCVCQVRILLLFMPAYAHFFFLIDSNCQSRPLQCSSVFRFYLFAATRHAPPIPHALPHSICIRTKRISRTRQRISSGDRRIAAAATMTTTSLASLARMRLARIYPKYALLSYSTSRVMIIYSLEAVYDLLLGIPMIILLSLIPHYTL